MHIVLKAEIRLQHFGWQNQIAVIQEFQILMMYIKVRDRIITMRGQGHLKQMCAWAQRIIMEHQKSIRFPVTGMKKPIKCVCEFILTGQM